MSPALPKQIEEQIATIGDCLRTLLPEQIRLLAAVLVLARRYGYCWAQQRALAERVKSAKSTVADDLHEFYALGLIRILKCDVARESGKYPHARGRSDVIVPAFGLDQAMADLRASRSVRVRKSRTESASVGRPRGASRLIRKAPTEVPKPLTARTIARSADDEFRPKASPEASVSHANLRSKNIPEHKATLVSVAENADAEALVAEGFDATEAAKVAALCTARPGLIARNIALGEHRKKANPPGWLRCAIRGDYASIRVSPNSEAAVHQGSRERSRSLPPAPLRDKQPIEQPVVQIVSNPPSDGKPIRSEIPPEIRERLTARAREEVARRLPFLGRIPETSPLVDAEIRRLSALDVRAFERQREGAPSSKKCSGVDADCAKIRYQI